MGECSTRSVLTVPAGLCALTMLIGIAAAQTAGVDVDGLFVPYLATAGSVTIICVLGFIFLEIAKLARKLEESPIPRVRNALIERAPLLILPALVFPLFLVGFTSAKVAIPFLVGYTWDAFWADADRLVFGDDAWRITYQLFGSSSAPFWEWFYTVGWGAVLFFGAGIVTLYAPRRKVAVFFTAMFATWMVGGCLAAYCFSAAGPVFAHLFDPNLSERFEPLRQFLAETLGNGPVFTTQAYLAASVHSPIAVQGGGISAMPSMHVGAMAIYVLAARGTKWLLPSILLLLIIFIASGYFGYHYWLDGVAGIVIAGLCWKAAEFLYSGKVLREPDFAIRFV